MQIKHKIESIEMSNKQNTNPFLDEGDVFDDLENIIGSKYKKNKDEYKISGKPNIFEQKTENFEKCFQNETIFSNNIPTKKVGQQVCQQVGQHAQNGYVHNFIAKPKKSYGVNTFNINMLKILTKQHERILEKEFLSKNITVTKTSVKEVCKKHKICPEAVYEYLIKIKENSRKHKMNNYFIHFEHIKNIKNKVQEINNMYLRTLKIDNKEEKDKPKEKSTRKKYNDVFTFN